MCRGKRTQQDNRKRKTRSFSNKTGEKDGTNDSPPTKLHRTHTSAYREASARGVPIYLFFSVNESRRFCGVAHMASPVDPRASLADWLPTGTHRWKGSFAVQVRGDLMGMHAHTHDGCTW